MYELKHIAKAILIDLEKSGDNIYDGISGLPPAGFMDSYRAQEELEFKTPIERQHQNTVELSKLLMSLDCNLYGVNVIFADKLIDYIEQKEYDVIDELTSELAEKKVELESMVEEIHTLEIKDFLSPIDYKRAVLHKIDLCKQFKRKMDYISDIIKTVEEFGNRDTYLPEPDSQYPDFSFNMTNYNNGFDAGKLK